MRKGRFSEEQMVAIIREADRDPVAAVAKRHGISEQTIYTWRKRFGGLQASDVKRLRQLEVENGRLKVSAVRLSAHPHFPQPRRPSHEPRPGAPAVANGKAAGAAQAAEEAHSRCAAATPASAKISQPGLVLRLRVQP